MLERIAACLALATLALAGCKGKDKTETGEKPAPTDRAKTPADAAPSAVKPDEPATLTPKTFSKDAIPKEIEIEGKITKGQHFSDGNGENWVVYSKKTPKVKDGISSEYLYAAHWARGPGGLKKLRDVRDKVEGCEYDLILELDEASVEVTDLDKDGIGEVGFGYELTCTSDVSPSTYKLLMLENGDKYIIRGSTTVSIPGEETFGGEMKIDKSFKDGPAEFLEHAKKRWPTLTKR